MIHVVDGDLFENEAEVWVNPVNCKGVMGKGIAKEFKLRFPQMYFRYRSFCYQELLIPGGLTLWRNLIDNPRPEYVFNVATKDHWRNNSQSPWIRECLLRTVFTMRDLRLHTVAMPALGCGEGKMEWEVVHNLIFDTIEDYCTMYNIEVWLYKPHDRK